MPVEEQSGGQFGSRLHPRQRELVCDPFCQVVGYLVELQKAEKY